MAFDGFCEIRRAVVSPDGRAILDLKDSKGSFDWRWCPSSSERSKEVLAVGMTAIACNKLVYCTIQDPDQPVIGHCGVAK